MLEHHKVPVIKITETFVHKNADSLELVHVGGYQVVVRKGQFKVGDLAIYVYPDSVVPTTEPFKFIWKDHMCDDGKGGFYVPEKRRCITVRKFRKEWSEGLLLPITDFTDQKIGALWHNGSSLVKEGDDVAELLGIYHYEPPEPESFVSQRKQQYKWLPKSLRGWFYLIMRWIGFDLNGPVGGANEKGPKNPPPVYDVEAFKNHLGQFIEGEEVYVTEKIHGSNARFMFDGKKFHVGSRKLWKSKKSKCIWREVVEANPWIEKWCVDNPHWTLFGEVIPTQGEKWTYGTGVAEFFAFDTYSPEGRWVKPWNTAGFVGYTVPLLYQGPFNEAEIKKLVDGKSQVDGATNIREGIVITPVNERHIHGLGRLQLKIVSNAFLEVS